MRYTTSFAACLLASAALMQPAFAADTMPKAAAKESAPQKAADMDFGKLSKDGAQAFRDMHMARLAIFDADPAKAKSDIADAKTALDKAKSDDAIFMKAEADLKPPMAAKASGDKTPTPAATTTGSAAPSHDKVAWLPVDAQLSLGENFVATPEKAGAVSEANKHLQTGDKQGAVERLKVAGIDVGLTVAVLPLNQTISDVGNAANLIDQGKYYEANAALKQTEDRMRFDVVDASTLPKGAMPAGSAATTPAQPAPAPAKGQ